MPASDSPATLVARFLLANNFPETLDVFLQEAGLPPDSGTVRKGDLTLEKVDLVPLSESQRVSAYTIQVLEEKKIFDISVSFEKLGTGAQGWTSPAPNAPVSVTALPARSNLLHVSLHTIEDADQILKGYLIASSADRRLHIMDVPSCSLHSSLTTLHDSPILSCAALSGRHLLTTSMSGQLVLSDLSGSNVEKRRDHFKFVVQVATLQVSDTTWVATAGWDAKVNIYRIDASTSQPKLGEPVATITFPTNPESLLFIKHPESGDPLLIVTRRDSTFLYYYTVDAEAKLLGRQNLAPHSNAWIAFTPSAMALCPIDSSMLAVATSAVPHMKLIIVRLMIPFGYEAALSVDTAAIPTTIVRSSLLDDAADPSMPTQASQARAALALQDRESEAIRIHCTTLAPQTPYSTPALAWRPDGSGVWVNSDDGVVRGIEASSGKIVSTLKGHEPGSKIRCLCAGWVEGPDGLKEEWLVSGGFDQKLVTWRPERT